MRPFIETEDSTYCAPIMGVLWVVIVKGEYYFVARSCGFEGDGWLEDIVGRYGSITAIVGFLGLQLLFNLYQIRPIIFGMHCISKSACPNLNRMFYKSYPKLSTRPFQA